MNPAEPRRTPQTPLVYLAIPGQGRRRRGIPEPWPWILPDHNACARIIWEAMPGHGHVAWVNELRRLNPWLADEPQVLEELRAMWAIFRKAA
jgi:hypothetical protein